MWNGEWAELFFAGLTLLSLVLTVCFRVSDRMARRRSPGAATPARLAWGKIMVSDRRARRSA
jgi:hypothetical protein